MSIKLTQKKWVIEQLEQNGKITRNECLKNYITRLGAIICDLKKDGYEFEYGEYLSYGTNKKDYIYRLKTTPKKILSFSDQAVEKFVNL
jgi:hypothetical protein